MRLPSVRWWTDRRRGCYGFYAAGYVITPETKFLHLEVVDQFGVMLPGTNVGIAQQCMPHHPQTDRQKDLSSKAARKLGVDDDEAAAQTKLLPDPTQHGQMMRHRVV